MLSKKKAAAKKASAKAAPQAKPAAPKKSASRTKGRTAPAKKPRPAGPTARPDSEEGANALIEEGSEPRSNDQRNGAAEIIDATCNADETDDSDSSNDEQSQSDTDDYHPSPSPELRRKKVKRLSKRKGTETAITKVRPARHLLLNHARPLSVHVWNRLSLIRVSCDLKLC